MKRNLNNNVVISLLAIFVFSCSEKYLGEEPAVLNPEFSVIYDEEAIVSLELATNVAKTFLGGEIAKKGGAKSLSKASSIETVKDKSNNPSMYVVNYPEGGWVIVGASKNYYPVLAYSDEGSFEIKPEAEMGGAFIWLEETKEAIRVSPAFDGPTKAQMRLQWQTYEASDKRISERSGAKNYQIMYDRMDQLSAQYGGSSGAAGGGWNYYYTLEDIRYLFDSYTYENILSMANMFGSQPEFTIVAIKDISTTYTVGPLLTTKWNQGSPFNSLVPNQHPAGCGAVAMAQVMNFHQRPYTYSYNGQVINWNATNNAHAPLLIAATGSLSNTQYWSAGSWAFPGNIKSGLQSVGYTVSQANHNYIATRNELLNNQRPVLMIGGKVNTPINLLSYINGHYWVCEGVYEHISDYKYFVEFFTGSGYNSYGWSTPTYPGSISVTGGQARLYMNWGWGGTNDGWYYNNSFPSGHNYQYDRQNYYISW